MKVTKRLFWIISTLCVAVCASAQQGKDSLRISLLTCWPGPEVYELFGHTGLRVQRISAEQPFDVVFNYGLFDFSTPHFVYRFTKGETDYCVAPVEFMNFYMAYAERDSRVVEQVLNLSQPEANALLKALIHNIQPQNRVYRYNFLFDNCATRPRNIIERSVAGTVRYDDPHHAETFRTEIDAYIGNYPWFEFGIDIALGAELDAPATYRQQMFVPMVLCEAFASARIERPSGETVPLVCETVELYQPAGEAIDPPTPWFLTPLFWAWVLLVVAAAVSLCDIYCRKVSRWFDTPLFFLYGAVGCIVFFLMFLSEHPATDVNYLALWLNPFCWIALLVWIKSCKKLVHYYHFANFAAVFVLLASTLWIPQTLNGASYPLIGVSLLRSAVNIVEYLRRSAK